MDVGDNVDLASMRPGLIRPGNADRDRVNSALRSAGLQASMRPGLIRPGNQEHFVEGTWWVIKLQ